MGLIGFGKDTEKSLCFDAKSLAAHPGIDAMRALRAALVGKYQREAANSAA